MSKSKLILADMGYISPPAEIPYKQAIEAMHTYTAGFADWVEKHAWEHHHREQCTLTTAQLIKIYDEQK